MSTDQAFQDAGARIEQILKDDALTSSDRFEQIKKLINQYINDGRDDVVDHLLAVAFRKSGGVYEIIADCIEVDLERGRIVLPDGSIAEGEINVLPMIIGHGEDLPVRAEWVHFLPPLPDGRSIPSLNDILLTWDDLTLSRNRIRELHQFLAKGSQEERRRALLSWRASNIQTGRFDRIWIDGNGRDSSLRFLVAYRLQDEAPWFLSHEQMLQWAASASPQVYAKSGVFVDIKAPRRLTQGLYLGHGQAEQMVIRRQFADIQRHGINATDTSALIELFGDQYTGVAGIVRITVTRKSSDTLLNQEIFKFGLKSIEGRAQYEMQRLLEHCHREGFSDVRLARLVQPVECIELSRAIRVLCVVLGPTAAFENKAPDGLPLDSAIDPPVEFAKWWDHERDTAAADINLTRAVLAAALELKEEELRCKAAFVVENGKWYASVIVDLTDARDRIREWPPSEAIDGAISFLTYSAARAWIRWVAVPSALQTGDADRQRRAQHENNSFRPQAVSPSRGAVGSEQKFLFQTDIHRFWEVVTNDDSKARFAALESLDDLLLVEAVRYGVFNNQEMMGPLASFYRGPVMQMSQDRRFAVYRHVAGFVEHTSTVSVNAFLPFIAEDDARLIVSTAVIDYVSLGPLTDGDPMSRVKDIIRMIESNMLENEGAAFGALLHIGDKRVCDPLIPLRDSLDQDAINEAVNSGTGFIHSATVEFCLDWLEGMEGTDQDSAFGLVASGLGLLKRKSRVDQVFTGNRPFPVRNVTPKQWQASQKPIPLAQYVQRVSSRMYALERTEPAPRVMPHVLTAWGLKPLTDPAEAAVLDDRTALTTGRLESEIIPGGHIVDVKKEWWDGEGNIFLTWGILNPNGPTLFVLGSRELDGKHRTFMRWLHMFGGCTTYAADAVSEITYQSIYEDAASIDEHLVQNHEHGLFHIIPSFLIANGGDETLADIAKRLLAAGAAAKDDWGRQMAYTRKFGSDFFARAGAEIRDTYESMLTEAAAKGEEPSEFVKMLELRYGHLPDFRDAKIPSWTETPMTADLLEEWWQIVSPREFQVAALVALRGMWEGAPNMLSDEMRANVVPWDSVIRFIEGYGLGLSKG